jgi:hypothetical protein
MTKPVTNRVDLDDSRVVGVSRESGRLVVELEQRRNNDSKRIEVRVTGALKETAEHYVGNQITAPHPDPQLPLDYIEYAERGDTFVELQGYLKNDSWYVWRIDGTDIEIVQTNNDEKAI